MLLSFRIGSFAITCAMLTACGGGGTPGTTATATPSSAPTVAPTPSPTPVPTPASTAPATISVSASTNTHAYTIVLQTTGSAVVTQNNVTTSNKTVPLSVTDQFFNDLAANSPIDDVQTDNGCTKSASYGTTTMITYMGYTTGDVSCPPTSTSPAQTLYTDAENVESYLGPFDN
jgi:hypothetical protein